ncbi:hypothetical protein HS088_TW14G00567 [Tripterygium wilfordii]|uniref:Uncharacterized protein n=1 Tax=Tripterygium wilfordii TaxID=458696 RepID=A0A7J7CQN5_TRIWF|nr:dystrophin-like [Tripterygium wilfordii]KAF5736425.1 hypothetical protein HS088_TW14G00567 [Tripterygium wilfordii]
MSELKLSHELEPQMIENVDAIQRSTHNLSFLHLNHNNTLPLCTNCGCFGTPPPLPPSPSTDLHHNPMKRRSPELATPSTGIATVTDPREPRTKKLFLDKQQTHSGQENSNLLGFTRISLPDTSPSAKTHSFPVLRRCASDPYCPPQSPPENAKPVDGNALLPPLPPSLRRSVSDPMPSPAKSLSRSSSSNEMGVERSPNSMRMKRMKEGLKEMTIWCEELLHEEEEEATAEKNSYSNAAKVDCGAEFSEAVNVERTGDCLTINFKCPCGNGYQILLSGSSCYYKLI